MNDAYTFMYERRPTTREEIREEIEPFPGTDYRAIYWCSARADNSLHPTRVGTIMRSEQRDFPRIGDRHVAEIKRRLLSRGIDPMAAALEDTRQCGMEFHTSIRMESFGAEAPWDRAYRSQFFVNHPEWRCIDYDGCPIAGMSYAVPEAQDQPHRQCLADIEDVSHNAIGGIDAGEIAAHTPVRANCIMRWPQIGGARTASAIVPTPGEGRIRSV